jgi:hypothetical protein
MLHSPSLDRGVDERLDRESTDNHDKGSKFSLSTDPRREITAWMGSIGGPYSNSNELKSESDGPYSGSDRAYLESDNSEKGQLQTRQVSPKSGQLSKRAPREMGERHRAQSLQD